MLWQRLIPWLAENRNLDSVSERFLRLWHNQNPSCRPAQGAGNRAGFEADVFFGYILSLHPLSRILMNSPDLWEMASRYFRIASPPTQYSTVSDVPEEYWDLTRAILLAGKIYRLNDQRSPSTRSLNTDTPQPTPPQGADSDTSADEATQESLARIAGVAQLACEQCQAALTDFRVSNVDEFNQFNLIGHCAACNVDSDMMIDPSEIRHRLPSPEPD